MRLTRIAAILFIGFFALAALACGGEAPFVNFSNWSVSPDPVIVGNPVMISADATNNNDNTEIFTFELWVDGIVTNTSVITLASGATQKVAFNYTPLFAVGYDHPGRYQVTILQTGGSAVSLNFNVIEAAE
ncbi:MAG: hypothetical protein WC333_09190 [Dehalococcoidia bacterium]